MTSEFWVSIKYSGMNNAHRVQLSNTREEAQEVIRIRKILDKENYSFEIPYVIEEVKKND
jgi:hypothetical protein